MPCLEKINRAIGYKPKISLDEAIDRIVADKKGGKS
jgi:nucleoside-diphosphate-sugar epimerase